METVHPFDLRAPSRIAALPLYVVTAIVLAAAAALIWLQIDRVVAARGVLSPPDDSIKAASQRAGVVERVLVREGQLVEAGQVLLRLDDRQEAAAVAALESQIASAKLEQAQREKLVAARRDLAAAEAELLARQRQAEQISLESLLAESQRLERELTRWENALARQQALAQENAVSQAEFEQAQLERDNAITRQAQHAKAILRQQSLLEQLAQKAEQAAMTARMEAEREELAILEGRRNLTALNKQLADANREMQRAVVRSPVRGTVHALSVRKGEVVSAADTVCRLAPCGSGLLAEAELAAADVGFVRKGQRARIKMDAFPFEDYGALTGRVEYVAADASRDAAGGKRLPQYTIRIRIDSEEFARRNARRLSLRPGMTLTAELVERRESLGAVLFKPLRKASRELQVP